MTEIKLKQKYRSHSAGRNKSTSSNGSGVKKARRLTGAALKPAQQISKANARHRVMHVLPSGKRRMRDA